MSRTTATIIGVVVVLLVLVLVWYFYLRPTGHVQAAVVTTRVSYPPPPSNISTQISTSQSQVPPYPALFVGRFSPYAAFNGQVATILKFQKVDGLIYMVVLMPNQSIVGIVDNVNVYSWLASVPQNVVIRVI